MGVQGAEDALFPVATAVPLVGKKGDFAADSNFTKVGNVVEYVAAVAKTAVGSAGTSLYADRDTKYAAWRLVVKTTAAAIVTENKAMINYRMLVLLGTAYSVPQSTKTAGRHATLALAGTQVLKVQ